MSPPLEGVKILELTDGLSGAFCGKLYAGLGADVLLVERPRTGTEVRWHPPFLNDLPGPERGGLFLYLGAGKRSLTLDTRTPDGLAVLEQLLPQVDLLVEDRSSGADGLTPGEEGALGRAEEQAIRLTLRPVSPGPYSQYSLTELQLAALGGWMMQVGEPDRTPLMTNSLTLSAFAPGLIGAIAGLAGLLAEDGKASSLDISAHESLLFCTRYNETNYASTGMEIKRYGRSFAGWSPTYRIFDCADGYATAAASTDGQVELLMALSGVDIDRYPTRDIRYSNADAFVSEVGAWFKSKTRDEAFQEAQDWRIPVGRISLIQELTQLEQLVARQFFVELDQPVAGRVVYPGNPARFSETAADSSMRAPLLGEHTVEVLREALGYSEEDIVALGRLGVI